MTDAFLALVASLQERDVRFVVIRLWGANYHAHSAGVTFCSGPRTRAM